MKGLTSHRSNPFYDGMAPDPDILERARSIMDSFPFKKNISHVPYEPRRKQRYLLIQDLFSPYLSGRMLDVGSRDTTLAEISGKPAELVDKNNPHLPSFDWEKELLPYEARSFDTVVCLDVLEHIDRIHVVFDDLLRISKKHVIISLPNCWRKVAKDIACATGRVENYGLPLEAPKDRHRWFFNAEEAVAWCVYRSLRYREPYTVRQVVFHAPKTRTWHKIFYPLLLWLCPRYMQNIFVETVFVVLARSNTQGSA